ncbi:MAG: HD domain-containing protein [Pseudolysinimonas sp.]
MVASTSTRLGRDIRASIPGAAEVVGYLTLADRDASIWKAALPLLGVRNNDGHSLYAYGMARALLLRIPEARERIVLPAILLHDIGWSTVADDLILEAIAPGGGRHDLVVHHERVGASLAREILERLGIDAGDVEEITAIIDGHDTRADAISIEDAIVKDSDKLWRLTPHGIRTVQGWFSLTEEEALRLCCVRVHDRLFTEAARAIAAGLSAVTSIDISPQGRAVPDPLSPPPPVS